MKVVYVDVDDTLVRTAGTKRIPMPKVVDQVKALKEQGVVLYLWSSGGAEYARESAIDLGLENCFVAFLPKPHAYIDDQRLDEWRFCQHFYPGQDLS